MDASDRVGSARNAPSDLRSALETQRHRDLVDRLDLIAREIEAVNHLLRRILEQGAPTQMRSRPRFPDPGRGRA